MVRDSLTGTRRQEKPEQASFAAVAESYSVNLEVLDVESPIRIGTNPGCQSLDCSALKSPKLLGPLGELTKLPD